MEYELYHAGVKGMKWGVRNDKGNSTGTSKNSRKSRNSNVAATKPSKRQSTTTTTTSKNGKQKAKLTAKRNRGAKLVAKNNNTKTKIILSNTANVAAGAMRVAGAFVPGLSVLSDVALAANLVGTVTSIK